MEAGSEECVFPPLSWVASYIAWDGRNVELLVGSIQCVVGATSWNARSEICCFSPVLPSVFLSLSQCQLCVVRTKSVMCPTGERAPYQSPANIHLPFQLLVPIFQVLVLLKGLPEKNCRGDGRRHSATKVYVSQTRPPERHSFSKPWLSF